MVDRARRDAGDLHGGAGHIDRQRLAFPHCGEPVGFDRRVHLGPDDLPHLERNRHPHDCLVRPAAGAQALPAGLRRDLHAFVIPVRGGHESPDAAPHADRPGGRRRRPPADRPGDPAQSFPRRNGQAMGVYGLGVVVAPIIGPVLGGWITDNYSWRWIFFINVPVGIIAMMLMHNFIHDPPWIRRARAPRLDAIGFLVFFMSLLPPCCLHAG